MENNKYITVKELLGDLMEHPMLQDLTLDRVINYSVNFCRKWGANLLFEEKIVTLKADNYRIQLPCDFYELVTLRDHCSQINYRYSTDVYHIVPNEHLRDDEELRNIPLTYKLNGNVLFLSTKDNEVDVIYQSIKTDNEDGFPMIYDDATYIQALKDYIKVQCFTILFDTGKIPQATLQNAQQQYGFSSRVLRNHFAMITPDEAESVANILNNMIIHRQHHHGFKRTGEYHKFKNH